MTVFKAMDGWLDRLTPVQRHSLFVASGIVIVALLNAIQNNYTTWAIPQFVIDFIGFLLPMTLAYVTTWTRQYGRGSTPDPAPEGTK